MRAFINSFSSEWLKKKHSLASWLVVCGGCFTPLIILIARLVYRSQLPKLYSIPGFWNQLWSSAWESMAIFLLPMGVVMATSLIVQIEYKNNAWKQVHTLPLTRGTIFFAKLGVVLVMLVQFFALFNITLLAAAYIPAALVSGVPFPPGQVPWKMFAVENGLYFIDCLPIVALQFLVSLRYRNFLVAVGGGFLLWILSIAVLSWKHGYWIPYTYTMFNHLKMQTNGRAIHPPVNFHVLAATYFVGLTAVSYILYLTKKEKG